MNFYRIISAGSSYALGTTVGTNTGIYMPIVYNDVEYDYNNLFDNAAKYRVYYRSGNNGYYYDRFYYAPTSSESDYVMVMTRSGSLASANDPIYEGGFNSLAWTTSSSTLTPTYGFYYLQTAKISGKYRFTGSSFTSVSYLGYCTVNVKVSINNTPYRCIYFTNGEPWYHVFKTSYSAGNTIYASYKYAVPTTFSSLYSVNLRNAPDDYTQISENTTFVSGYEQSLWDFGDVEQEVPKPFYDWVTSNATYVYPNTYTIKSYTGSVQLAELTEAPPMTSGILSTTGNTHYLTLTGSNDTNYTLNWTSTKVPPDGQFLGLGYKINQGVADYKTGSTFDIDWENSLTLYEQYGTPSQDYTKFDVNLYHNNAENIVLDKTGYLTSVGMLSGALRENCDLYRPSILVELPELPIFNYCYIGILNRYYYVESIQSVRYTLWQVNLKCDVLMTYKTQLLGLNAFVARSASHYNPAIIDKELPLEYERKLYYNSFDTCFKPIEYVLGTFLYVVVSSPSTVEDSTRINGTESELSPIPANTFSPWINAGITVYRLSSSGAIEYFYDNILTDTTKTNLILSMYRCPIDLVNYSIFDVDYETTTMYVGDTSYDFTNLALDRLVFTDTTKYTYTINIGKPYHFSNYETSDISWITWKPYYNFRIYIPYYGWVDIPREHITDDLNVKFVFDMVYGNCTFIISNGSTIINTSDLDFTVNVPINYTNATDVERQTAVNNIKAISTVISGLFSGITSAGTNLASGAIAGALLGGVADIANGITSAILTNQADEIMNVASGGSNSSGDSYNMLYTPYKILTEESFVEPTFDIYQGVITDKNHSTYYDEYIKLKGLPYCKTVQLSELSGVAYINDIHLENFSTALDEEKNDIATSLANGVIFPEQETAEDDVS